MTPPTRSESQAHTRQCLVDAATDMIASSGVESLVLDDVASRAGFSRGAFYSNFADKSELVGAVQAGAIELAVEFMAEARGAGGSSAQRLDAYIDSNLEFCGARPRHALAIVKIAIQLAWSATAEFARAQQQSDPALVAIFDDGQRDGEMRRFDSGLMSRLVRNAIDSSAGAAAAASAVDRRRLIGEMVRTFERATVRPASDATVRTASDATSRDPLDDAVERIARADELKRAVDNKLVLRGIGTDDFLLLRAIDGAPGGQIARSDLAVELTVAASDIVRRIVPLEKLGWVARTRGRGGAATLEITASGHDLVEHCADLARDAVAAHH